LCPESDDQRTPEKVYATDLATSWDMILPAISLTTSCPDRNLAPRQIFWPSPNFLARPNFSGPPPTFWPDPVLEGPRPSSTPRSARSARSGQIGQIWPIWPPDLARRGSKIPRIGIILGPPGQIGQKPGFDPPPLLSKAPNFDQCGKKRKYHEKSRAKKKFGRPSPTLPKKSACWPDKFGFVTKLPSECRAPYLPQESKKTPFFWLSRANSGLNFPQAKHRRKAFFSSKKRVFSSE